MIISLLAPRSSVTTAKPTFASPAASRYASRGFLIQKRSMPTAGLSRMDRPRTKDERQTAKTRRQGDKETSRRWSRISWSPFAATQGGPGLPSLPLRAGLVSWSFRGSVLISLALLLGGCLLVSGERSSTDAQP